MKIADLTARAREAAKEYLALHGDRELSESVLLETYRKNIPNRERSPGDDIIFRATFVANVTRMKAERKVKA